MPSVVIWNDRQSENLSTVRPGRPSDSPKTTRYASEKPSVSRYAFAAERRAAKNARSIVSDLSRVKMRTVMREAGLKYPRATKRRRESITSTMPPGAQSSSTQSISLS